MKNIICSNEYEAIREITLGGTIKKAHLIFNYPNENDITCSVLEVEPAALVHIRLNYKPEEQARIIIDEFIWKEVEKAGLDYYGFRFAENSDEVFFADLI